MEYLTTNAPKNRLRVQQVSHERNFCKANLMVNSQRVHEVTLPKLFKWYKDDFGFSKQARSRLMHTLHFALRRCSSQEILAYYASFMPPGMREEQTEVTSKSFDATSSSE